MRKYILALAFVVFLLSGCGCASGDAEGPQRTASRLTRTGEFLTAAQMEPLKAQALSWQSAFAGMGPVCAYNRIRAFGWLRTASYISFGAFIDGSPVFDNYERILIEADVARAQILGTALGAGSGEISLAYKLVRDDCVWVEVFGVLYDGMFTDGHNTPIVEYDMPI